MSMSKMSFDLEKFPHLISVKQGIDSQKRYIECMNKRKVLIKENTSEKTEYQKNEDEIVVLRTDWELAKAHKNLREKEDYFRDFSQQIAGYIDEVNEKYDQVYEKAKAYKVERNKVIYEQLQAEFDAVKDVDMDDDWQMRIKHYITLKTILNPKKKK